MNIQVTKIFVYRLHIKQTKLDINPICKLLNWDIELVHNKSFHIKQKIFSYSECESFYCIISQLFGLYKLFSTLI